MDRRVQLLLWSSAPRSSPRPSSRSPGWRGRRSRGSRCGSARTTRLATPRYLVHHDGEWTALERDRVRQSGVPFWSELLQADAPPVGGLLLGLVATGWRHR